MGSVEVLWDGDGVPPGKDMGQWGRRWGTPRKNMGPVEVLWEGDRVTPPPNPGCEQTEYITCRSTWYTGGKKIEGH